MNDWLQDAAVEKFFSDAFVTTDLHRVQRESGNPSWMVFDETNRRYLGMITQSGRKYDVFTPLAPKGNRVSTIALAIQLIQIPLSSTWIEDGSRRYARGGVVRNGDD
jgi:hypothetical protein